MEPADVSLYASEAYWNARYKTEKKYDWFPSVYEPTLKYLTKFLVLLAKERNLTSKDTLNVLHLGCGNSSLIVDIHDYWNSLPTNGPSLHQIGLDFSQVVIDHMKHDYGNDKIKTEKSSVSWVVGDIRHLRDVALISTICPVDVVIDKGTMDALQAHKENENLDEELDMMLKSVEHVLISSYTKYQEKNKKAFIQITWEIPYYRFAITNSTKYCWYSAERPESYKWDTLSTIPKDQIWYSQVGDSDMYYMFIYRV